MKRSTIVVVSALGAVVIIAVAFIAFLSATL
jgi:hypothetical protein